LAARKEGNRKVSDDAGREQKKKGRVETHIFIASFPSKAPARAVSVLKKRSAFLIFLALLDPFSASTIFLESQSMRSV